jgi:hypothetical protein
MRTTGLPEVRWFGRRRGVVADDGIDPELGIPADRIEFRRPGDDYRVALLDAAGRVISSFDLDRGDLHDMKRAITMVMAVKR